MTHDMTVIFFLQELVNSETSQLMGGGIDVGVTLIGIVIWNNTVIRDE